MPRTLVFDVNETLLDLGVLAPRIEALTGGPQARWFLELQRLWLVATATDHYQDFPTLIGHALRSVADGEVSDADVASVLDAVVQLPAHPDVPPALDRLHAAGYRLAALTNGTLDAVRQQLDHTGIADRFDVVMSADEVQRYKPAPEPYRFAARKLDSDLGDLTMVAAHAWDVAGAHRAGMRTAFVARPGKAPVPGWPAPDIQGPDLGAIADALLGSADA
ncbi:haloacid dehalogenase type II [Rubrivirga sp. IMCC43871]|uniref:haloacid dehalogenase type II n=1 Tax=Rubrivirga sp. IMCC43871 TaxID=3391575 RepID=UPI0039901B01